MAREGLAVEDLSPAVVERFCSACRAAGYHHYTSIRGVKPLMAYLRAVGLAGEERMAQSPLELVLVRFACWLERERHLAPVSIATYVSHARPLLERFAVADRVALERLDAAAVRRFVVEVCPLQGRASAKLTVVAVRQLLAFLYVDGELERPLSAAVPSVAGIRLSGLPKRLERGEVQRILDACDRETVTGRRGFAIVMLMARLGVRGGEIANLVLDDIDWRAGEITVRGKGQELRLPLPAAVGEALVAYLGNGRPAGVETRAVFVTRLPPVRAMSRAAIREEIARLSERAGLGRVNAHRLRHTLAAEMLAGGADLPAIGQVLGHRMLETTAIYALGAAAPKGVLGPALGYVQWLAGLRLWRAAGAVELRITLPGTSSRKELLMVVAGSSTRDVALAAFDDHLRRVRGVCPEVRRSYGRVAGEFLEMVFGDGPVDLARLSASDVVRFVFEATVRYRPSTLQGVTTALRSFLRFLRVEGVRDDRLEDVVPKVPLRRLSAVPRYLGSGELARLIASLAERDLPAGLRARAMLLLAARLGLRASEIARLELGGR